jgi:hypothetical protein
LQRVLAVELVARHVVEVDDTRVGTDEQHAVVDLVEHAGEKSPGIAHRLGRQRRRRGGAAALRALVGRRPARREDRAAERRRGLRRQRVRGGVGRTLVKRRGGGVGSEHGLSPGLGAVGLLRAKPPRGSVHED